MCDNNSTLCYTCYMPDGTPVAELLTEEEAIVFLRLDTDGPEHPEKTLKHYRNKGLLNPTKIGKRNTYSKMELLRFIDSRTGRERK